MRDENANLRDRLALCNEHGDAEVGEGDKGYRGEDGSDMRAIEAPTLLELQDGAGSAGTEGSGQARRSSAASARASGKGLGLSIDTDLDRDKSRDEREADQGNTSDATKAGDAAAPVRPSD